jgi:hypothetical protein
MKRVRHAFAETFDLTLEKAMFIHPHELLGLCFLAIEDDSGLSGIRSQNSGKKPAFDGSNAQDAKGVAMAGFDKREVIVRGKERGGHIIESLGLIRKFEQIFLSFFQA